MTLFSDPTCFYSHRTRLVLAEKNINIDIINVDTHDLPEDLLDLNPYHSVPTLVDRDLVLYDSRVIIEYLDERFPHPPLMPVDPVVNDHLGDVYWAVGRYREAEFQWKRALSFIDPDDTDGEADPDRIRRKLAVGLDYLDACPVRGVRYGGGVESLNAVARVTQTEPWGGQ